MLKPRLSDIIKHQANSLEVLMCMMKKPCSYPLDNEPDDIELAALLDLTSPFGDFKTIEDRLEWEKGTIKEFKEIREEVERNHSLDSVAIDISAAMLVLKERADEYLFDDYKFKPGSRFVLIGEIPQMPGHLVVSSLDTDKPILLTCVHSYNFFIARPMDV